MSRAAAEKVTGEPTVAPFTGAQIFTVLSTVAVHAAEASFTNAKREKSRRVAAGNVRRETTIRTTWGNVFRITATSPHRPREWCYILIQLSPALARFPQEL